MVKPRVIWTESTINARSGQITRIWSSIGFPTNRKAGPKSFLRIFYYHSKLLSGTSWRVEMGLAITLNRPASCGFKAFIRDIGDKDYYDIGNLFAGIRFEVRATGCILPALACSYLSYLAIGKRN